MFLTDSDIDRFWSNVDRRSEAECWPWTRSRNQKGYGQFKLNGKMECSHRVSWVLDENRQIPDLFEGLPSCICHSCDRPSCCNPVHLFLGNQAINMKDASSKDRKSGPKFGSRGESNQGAKITDFQVKGIKQDFKERILTQQQIAEKYGVSQSAISFISTGKTWSHVN